MSSQQKFTIYVIEQMHAPNEWRYAAAFNPLDEGDHWPHGMGPTIEAAVTDLIENYDRPWDEPTP